MLANRLFHIGSGTPKPASQRLPGPESEIPPGNFLFHPELCYPENTYRTRDGGACFDFYFHRERYCFELYLLSAPGRNYCRPRIDKNKIQCHQKIEPGELGYNQALRTYSQAAKMAALWAEYNWENGEKSSVSAET
jgi:hypothetical protein